MYSDLNVFKLAHAMASHAGQRQSVIAQNVANADTPGYRAQDIKPFSEMAAAAPGGPMRLTRPGHIGMAGRGSDAWDVVTPDTPADPNGNSVSIELEMMKSVELKRQHDRALAIYKSSMNVLRAAVRQ